MTNSLFPRFVLRHLQKTASLGAVCALAALAGCGGGGSTGPTNPTGPTANATLVLMLTATGNDRLTSFNGPLSSLTLTNQAGTTVNVFSSNPVQGAPEFHHLNGTTEPYLTTTVPQGTYISATLAMSSAQFACASYVSGANGGLNNSAYAVKNLASTQVSVSLPTPLTISTATGLALNLQEAASASFPSCVQTGISTYTITPTFTLTQLPFGQAMTSLLNGEPTTLHGTIASVASGGGGITVALPDGPMWPVTLQANTLLQGTTSLSSLAVGQPIDSDVDFGADGSLSSSRVQVFDTNTANITTILGNVEFVSDAQPTLELTATQVQGTLANTIQSGEGAPFSFGSSSFGIDGSSTILQNLPFKPTFTAATMVPGQNVLLTSHATAIASGPLYVPASTVTLMPQTVNATITGVATSGLLTTYTVTLAPFDLFVNLASQAGQNSQIATPSTMTVYTYQGNTGLASSSIVSGQTFRFTGLVFNDNGVLRMACSQVLAGVAL